MGTPIAPLEEQVTEAIIQSLIIFVPIMIAYAICIMQAGSLAMRRGRSRRKWTFRTVLFGPFALLVLAILPSRREETPRRSRHRRTR